MSISGQIYNRLARGVLQSGSNNSLDIVGAVDLAAMN
jgi:hypothetical protein